MEDVPNLSGLALSKIRDSKVLTEIENQTGNYGKLLEIIKEEVINGFNNMRYVSFCAKGHSCTPLEASGDFYNAFKREVREGKSWVQQSPLKFVGYQHPDPITNDNFYDFISAYRSVVPRSVVPADVQSGRPKLETYNQVPKINEALVKYAEHFMPMIKALHRAGFVDRNHNKEYNIKWRFHGARHEYGSVWHMDAGDYSPYADECGEQLREWTKTGTRCIVTAGCVNTTNKSLIYNCGTKLMSGVPVLTQQALEKITSILLKDRLLSTSPACNATRTRIQFTDTLFNSTTTALDKYIADGEAAGIDEEAQLKTAGIEVVSLENGIIASYNDSVFHSGDKSTPEGFERCFFVACPTIRNDRNRPVPFIPHATLSDGSKLMFSMI